MAGVGAAAEGLGAPVSDDVSKRMTVEDLIVDAVREATAIAALALADKLDAISARLETIWTEQMRIDSRLGVLERQRKEAPAPASVVDVNAALLAGSLILGQSGLPQGGLSPEEREQELAAARQLVAEEQAQREEEIRREQEARRLAGEALTILWSELRTAQAARNQFWLDAENRTFKHGRNKGERAEEVDRAYIRWVLTQASIQPSAAERAVLELIASRVH